MVQTRMRLTRMLNWNLSRGIKLRVGLCVAALSGLCIAWGEPPFSDYMLQAVRAMPSGGGYASDRAAEVRFAQKGAVWDARRQRLTLSPRGASPTFCSAACYLTLLHALQLWEKDHPDLAFSPRVWESLRVETQHPDGFLNWGRMNANGPGCAKWIHDLGAGINFTAVEAARPGDLLKFFHTEHIGERERGHMVIFLGLVRAGEETCVRFWSSNSPQGYGVRQMPLSKMRHPIFTRITHPERFAHAATLPQYDTWLATMLTHSFRFAELVKKCAISAAPER